MKDLAEKNPVSIAPVRPIPSQRPSKALLRNHPRVVGGAARRGPVGAAIPPRGHHRDGVRGPAFSGQLDREPGPLVGLHILFAARPHLLGPVLRIVRRVIGGFVLRQAGLKRATADAGSVTLIQMVRVGGQPEHPPALPGARRGGIGAPEENRCSRKRVRPQAGSCRGCSRRPTCGS